MGVLGGRSPPNTPYLPHRHGNSQRTRAFGDSRDDGVKYRVLHKDVNQYCCNYLYFDCL